jgi:hypothetical protein
MTIVETVSGNVGYRHQLDRVRRFLDRVEGPNANDVEFQDMMWAFFQNCWHLKDWVKNDPLASEVQKNSVIDQAHASALLGICRDLCNGTKHLGLDQNPSSGTGAAHHHINITIKPGESSSIDCVVDDGHGSLISGRKLARDCVKEWERILQSEGLNTTRLS